VTNKEEPTMTTILTGTDTTAAADLAVDDAARLAHDRGAELLVLYVERDGDDRRAVDPARAPDPGTHLAKLAARYPGLSVKTRVEHGDPAERLVEVAAEVRAEAIVVGNRGAQGSRWRVRDAVPSLVLRHAPCSVFIVDTRRAQ
jgi:nucleotide-binding universal stress UspA family protein